MTALEGLTLFFLAAIALSIWAAFRMCFLTFGKHKEHIAGRGAGWIILLTAMWYSLGGLNEAFEWAQAGMKYGYGSDASAVMMGAGGGLPWFSIGVVSTCIYVLLFGGASASKLMTARKRLIETITPDEVIEAAESAIQKNNLTGDAWVQEHWANVSNQAWVDRLAANPKVYERTLTQKLRITVFGQGAWADWIDLLNQFMYFESKSSAENRSNENLPAADPTSEGELSVSAVNLAAETHISTLTPKPVSKNKRDKFWEVNCPHCGKLQPKVRVPTSFKQAMLGGFTCSDCGTDMDGQGKPTISN